MNNPQLFNRFHLSSFIGVLTLALLVTLGFIYILYQEFYLGETVLGLVIVSMNYVVGCKIRNQASGQNMIPFLKLILGKNGIKTLITLGVMLLIILTLDVDVLPFLITIFVTYAIFILFDTIKIYSRILKQD